MGDNQGKSRETVKDNNHHLQKTPRNRRKNRKKNKEKKVEKKKEQHLQIEFKIVRIAAPICGITIRPNRVRKSSKINLQQFYTTDSKLVEFSTNMQRIPLAPLNRNQETSPKTDNSTKFPPYISETEAKSGLQNGTLLQGSLRINPRMHRQAFCTNANPDEPDHCIENVYDRNRALHGDVVVLKKKGTTGNLYSVVYILEKVHPRTSIGFLEIQYVLGKPKPMFAPRDVCFPKLNLLRKSLPSQFFAKSKTFASTMYTVRLLDWNTVGHAIGEVLECLGPSLNLAVENKAILFENNINNDFTPEALTCVPSCYDITDVDITERLDLRHECIFTIDPLTARDLDDALHIKVLPNGNYEVGVHIADVAHYLEQDSVLDKEVAERATSVYFVEQVFHMLPKEFCMNVSLLPGRDCLAFSVIWELNNEADIISTRFGRSVINSCTQLAYEHAQAIIDGGSTGNDLPVIHGRFTPDDICLCVDRLNGLARQMRKRRYDNGALKISQTKFSFMLNEKLDPIDFMVHENGEANFLIEEFMLLANISVATKIYEHYPDLAFLRKHDKPFCRMLKQLRDRLEIMGLQLNFDSSTEIQNCLTRFKAMGPSEYPKYVALNHMLMIPMKQAKYFCTDNVVYEDFHHYGLSIPIYTHFTSPIRRYADVMVHRLLAASLGLCKKPNWSTSQVQAIAEHCNRKKTSAKKAGDASCNLTLARFIQGHSPFIVNAVVVKVTNKYFDVVVLRTGSAVRLFLDDLDKLYQITVSTETIGEEKICKWSVQYSGTLNFPSRTQNLDIFLVVPVNLKWKSKYSQFSAELVHPDNKAVF